MQEFNKEFKGKNEESRLLLSITVPAGIVGAIETKYDVIDKGYDFKKLNQYVDWYNIPAFDYHTATHDKVVNHLAPLLPSNEDDDLNIVSYYI